MGSRFSHLGLRSRVTLAFALGALILSASMGAITYLAARQVIIQQRKTSALHQAYVNASLVRSALRSPTPRIPELLDSLDTLPGSRSVLERRGQWFATSISIGKQALPRPLRPGVVGGSAATQSFLLSNTPELAVGIPVPSVDAAYFEVFSFGSVARTLRVLALALAGAALVTTIAGAVIGRWLSGRALRPLGTVSKAAVAIAGGRLDTRLPTDDSDLEPMARSFNHMADALVERIAREARFTSDVSHELRSPLTTLNTSLEVLETHSGELSSRASQALALIATELRRFGRMVTDLLEMSRVDSGAAELSTEEVAVGELVVHLATSSGAGVPAVLDPAVADRRVRVDKRRMERVAANLVDNAAQYAGGVTRFAAEHSAGRVRLVVADRGPGVAEEDRSRIFERFYRGTLSGRRGETQGSGLGLSLVAEHVKMHGGRVFVEARDGENRFVVELPLADEPLRAANDNADNAPSGREVPRR